MSRGEFYCANEYNDIGEFKHFPAEIYRKPWEENPSGKEQAALGEEATTLQPKPQKLKKSGEASSLVDKLFNSLRGAATVATVAVASVAVTTSFVTSAPQAELVSYECGDTYIEYEMQVDGLEEDGAYAIVLSTTNEEDVRTEVDGNGTYQNRIEGLRPEWEYTLSLVQYDAFLGEIRHMEVKLQTLKHADQEPIPPPAPEPEPEPEPDPAPVPAPKPCITVTDTEIIGINKVRAYFTCTDLPEGALAELDVLLGDAGADRILLTAADVAAGYADLVVESSATITVTPVILIAENGETVSVECDTYTHTFVQNLHVEVMVGLADQSIMFYPIGIACGADLICVTSSLEPDEPELLWFEEVVQLWCDASDVITYTLYLTNENGDVLSNEVSVTVDTTVSLPSYVYNLNAVNPGDVGVTYNDDGTINLYIQTSFSAQDEAVYYQITVGGIRYVSREPLARIERIPDQSYALRYDVCVDIDGKQYSIFNTTPSGMVNEAYFYLESSLEDTALHLWIYKDAMYIDLDTVVLTSSVGEEIRLAQGDFVYNEEHGYYEAQVTFTERAEEVTVSAMANPFYNGLDGVGDYIGNTRKIFEITVYQP